MSKGAAAAAAVPAAAPLRCPAYTRYVVKHALTGRAVLDTPCRYEMLDCVTSSRSRMRVSSEPWMSSCGRDHNLDRGDRLCDDAGSSLGSSPATPLPLALSVTTPGGTNHGVAVAE